MNVKRELKKAGIEPRKSWDQFFLSAEWIENEVWLADLTPGDTVLEIGAGPGNLTRRIVEKCDVIAVERDKRFAPLLKETGARVIIGDAAQKMRELEFNKIVSNIPYRDSQQILLALLKKKWERAVLVVQKEFAEKLLDEREKLGMLMKDCCDVRKEADVPADVFYPEAAESAIVVLKQKRTMDKGFWDFLKNVFRNRNKNVSNAVPGAGRPLADKKVHQLTLDELRELYESRANQR